MNTFNGKCGISVKILKDSLSLSGSRLSTFEIVYPRIILSELNTHRALSKNSASSRAVPYKLMSDIVASNPALPVHWGKNQPGMSAREELSEQMIELCKAEWIGGLNDLAVRCDRMNEYGLHKQVINRLQEYGTFMKTVITGTDWDNLLYLRDDEEAQPEFGELASLIRTALETSKPDTLLDGEWHLPYVHSIRDVNGDLKYFDSDGNSITEEVALKISASCCAQVSYRRLNDSMEKALEVYSKLFSGRKPHMSPTEHQGMSIAFEPSFEDSTYWPDGVTHITRDREFYSGNLRGWIQHRQIIPNNVYRAN